MTRTEVFNNKRAFEHALAQQSLEGLVMPPEAVDDLHRVMRGEITTTEALRVAHARFDHDKIRQ